MTAHHVTSVDHLAPQGQGIVVGFRCDAGDHRGVGHLIRCIALAEEVCGRGHSVVFITDTGTSDWAAAQILERGFPRCDPPNSSQGLAELAVAQGLAAVVLDGYELPQDCGWQLHCQNIIVLSIFDGVFGANQFADIYLDQNLGAVPLPTAPATSVTLCGPQFTLFRDCVLVHIGRKKPDSEPPDRRSSDQALRILTVFGGTDPFGASPVLVSAIFSTELPVSVIAIAAHTAAAEALQALRRCPGQALETTLPVDDLPSLAVQADLVITAAGSSIWELSALGVAAAVVSVTTNQIEGYAEVIRHELAAPLGTLSDLQENPATQLAAISTIRRLLTDTGYRERLASRGPQFIDGQGRRRVADALLGRCQESASERRSL